MPRFFVLFFLIGILFLANELSAQRIHGIACRGNLELLDSLLNTQYDINAKNKYDRHRSLLHYAIGCNQDPVFQYLLDRGINVNILDDEGQTPLFTAVRNNKTAAAIALIQHGANVNVIDQFGYTPLHKSVLYNNASITRLLLEKGVHLEVINNKGNTALDIAQREGFTELEALLLAAHPKSSIPFQAVGKYIDPDLPGNRPQLFAPNFISTEHITQNAVFHPNMKEFYFTQVNPANQTGTIMISKLVDGTWSRPESLGIPGDYREVDPFITTDGQQLYYSSNRPVDPAQDSDWQVDLWVLNRVGDGWSDPIHLGEPINSEQSDWFPCRSDKGSLVFGRQPKTKDIFISKFENGRWSTAVPMSDSINSPALDYDPYIAPDEQFLIFSSNRKGGYGMTDLYISFKNPDGSWSKAQNMGPEINSSAIDLTPSFSPDGRFFFFSSARAGVVDLYWVDAQVIESLR
ncbi:MAG: ankyrin repeat domain-containing protein [Bacteroidota bacterium]